MSWEALRWTAKTPSELYHVLGPHGVNDLIRQAIAAVWRDLPAEGRSFEAARALAREIFARNLRAWGGIKQPTPQAFFADLHPHAADGFVRQAMVMTWMMMPRAGGRTVRDALRIVADVFERNVAAWAQDNETFTTGGAKRKRRAAPKRDGDARDKAKAAGGKMTRAGGGAKKPTAGSTKGSTAAKPVVGVRSGSVAPPRARAEANKRMKKASAGKGQAARR